MLTPKQYFESHGISIKEVSQVIGRTERTTKRKLDELSTWKGSEMVAICDRYEDFDPNYFFYPLYISR